MTINDAFSYISNETTRVSKPGLVRIYECMRLLGSPEKTLPIIHVVGTNGKGSVTTMLASALRSCGYLVGTMTSPYLGSLLDMYHIDGHLPTEEQYITAVSEIKEALDGTNCQPTEFELSVAVAIELFADARCDVVILEAGMGGGKDATNLETTSVLTIATQIGIDHEMYLGNDAFAIAEEKLGITKPTEPVVLGPNTPAVTEYVRNWCANHGNSFSSSDEIYGELCTESEEYEDLMSPMKRRLSSEYQIKNIATVLTALEVLKQSAHFSEPSRITKEACIRGIREAYLPYRFDVRSTDPHLIFDGGHNPDCIEALCNSLMAFSQKTCYHIVTGVMRDKDYDTMYRRLAPFAKSFCTVTPANARALPAEELAEHLKQYGVPVTVTTSIDEAASYIRTQLESGENVLVTGTLYMMYDLDQTLSIK